MPKFNYTAKDSQANVFTGVIEAKDSTTVARELKSKNLTVISIVEEKEKKVLTADSAKRPSGGRVKPMELVVLSRQLATLIDSGVSLVVGLNILQEQVESPYLKRVMGSLKGDIEAGNSLSASFAKYPSAFPGIFSNMVKAGESSGSLNEILERIAEYLERGENLRRKVTSAMVYPVIVVGMAVVIMGFLMLKVVPTFKTIFATLGGNLPLPTQILISISDNSVKLFPVLVVVLIILIIAFKKYISTPKGRMWFDQFKLKLPVFGVLISKIAISRFASTLAILVKSGVNILEAFDIVSRVTGNKVFEVAIEQVKTKLQAGENISEPMEATKKFPPFVSKMIAVGEQTGELEKMLSKISEYYETQITESLSALTSMLEPLIILFLGVSIGFIVVAMFLPIFKLTTLLGAK